MRSARPVARKLTPPSHNPPTIIRVHFSQPARAVRRVLRLKKNAATKQISTRVMKGVASPNRNQAIAQGGKEIEISLIDAAGREKSARDQYSRKCPIRNCLLKAQGTQAHATLGLPIFSVTTELTMRTPALTAAPGCSRVPASVMAP